MSHDLVLLIFEPEGNLPMRKHVLRTPYRRLSPNKSKHGQPTCPVTTTASLRLDRGKLKASRATTMPPHIRICISWDRF
jgi:hypothetical protein